MRAPSGCQKWHSKMGAARMPRDPLSNMVPNAPPEAGGGAARPPLEPGGRHEWQHPLPSAVTKSKKSPSPDLFCGSTVTHGPPAKPPVTVSVPLKENDVLPNRLPTSPTKNKGKTAKKCASQSEHSSEPACSGGVPAPPADALEAAVAAHCKLKAQSRMSQRLQDQNALRIT